MSKAATIGIDVLPVTKIQFGCKAVDNFDGVELRKVANTVRDACVGMFLAFNSPEKGATESFHNEGPVAPYWTHVSDIIRNMEKGVDGECAKRESFG